MGVPLRKIGKGQKDNSRDTMMEYEELVKAQIEKTVYIFATGRYQLAIFIQLSRSLMLKEQLVSVYNNQ